MNKRHGKQTTLVGLGKNWQKKHHPHSQGEAIVSASYDTYQTAIAVAELYRHGKGNSIIFSTGHTLGQGKSYPSEAEIMKQYVRTMFSQKEIPDKAIFLENESIDTAGNAEKVGIVLKKLQSNRATIVTVKRHRRRAAILFRNYNPSITITTAVTEEVLTQYGYTVKELPPVEKLKEYLLEVLLNCLLIIDPFGKIPRLITRKIRK